MINTVFEYICPVLIVMWIIGGLARTAGVTGVVMKSMLALVSLFIALYPVGGLSVSDYILSLNPNFSIGSAALLLIVISRVIFNRKLMTGKDLKLFVIWNMIISLIVMVPALGFTDVDIYSSGYGSTSLFILMALATIVLVYRRSPLSYIFISYIAAFNLKILPSSNFFDYITDGVLFFISIGVFFSLIGNKTDG